MYICRLRRYLLTTCLLLIALGMHAQRRVIIKHADELLGARSATGESFQKLIGKVWLTQSQTAIYCDSAYLYKARNTVEAFGHVRIVEGDSVRVSSHRLEYDGNTRTAKLRSNVVFEKLGMATLYTDYLDYDRIRNMAYYYNKGRLVDSINQLTSYKGYYDVRSNMASFKRDVKVTNPDYTMTSDSLQYNSRTKIIYFRSMTTVVNRDSSTFEYEAGEYDTRIKQYQFRKGILETKSYELEGLNYQLDDIRRFYGIRGAVKMTSKQEELTIHGQAVDYNKAKEICKVFDNPWLEKATSDGDTLYIRADTMVSIDSGDPEQKRLLAYRNVRIFKKDMQGTADSLVYVAHDSTIYFYKNPVLWTQGNQMTADTISMLIKNNTISRVYLTRNAFVISQDTLLHYNQIKGRNMTAEITDGAINRVYVEGNGESLYFALDERNAFTGMNKIICSNIMIRFKGGQVDNFTFYVQPDASFIPPHELTPDVQKLKGFMWNQDARPTLSSVKPDVPRSEKRLPRS